MERMVVKLTLCVFIITQLSESKAYIEDGRSCDCKLRYLQHYNAKGCKVVEFDDCNCPIKYHCPSDEDIGDPNPVCLFQNTEYRVGSVISINNPCLRCRCVNPKNPQIYCAHKECPLPPPPERTDCYVVYKNNSCCPYAYQCENTSYCERGGQRYPVGAKMTDPKDVCLTCHCIGQLHEECIKQECMLEKDRQRLARGCIPVYHEKKCCPIEFYCPEDIIAEDIGLLDTENINAEIRSGGQCSFGGRTYEIGEPLSSFNKCFQCQCEFPPDITCILESCTSPENTDQCNDITKEDDCCPKYECPSENSVGNITFQEPTCRTDPCPEHCVTVRPPGHLCSVCVCRDLLDDMKIALIPGKKYKDIKCATTLCAENCISATPPEHICSVCACSDSPTFLTVTLLSNIAIEGFTEDFSNETSMPTLSSYPEESIAESIEIKEMNPELEEEGNYESEMFEPVQMNATESSHREENEFEMKSSKDTGEMRPNESFLTGEMSESNVIEQLEEEYLVKNPAFYNAEQDVEEDNSNELLSKLLHIGDIKRKRRSPNLQINSNRIQVHYNEWPAQNQQQRSDDSSDEREREDDDSDFDDLKIMKSSNAATLIHVSEEESRNVVWREIVPGCPMPLCEGPSCRIGIPPGYICPTCICRNLANRQP